MIVVLFLAWLLMLCDMEVVLFVLFCCLGWHEKKRQLSDGNVGENNCNSGHRSTSRVLGLAEGRRN